MALAGRAGRAAERIRAGFRQLRGARSRAALFPRSGSDMAAASRMPAPFAASEQSPRADRGVEDGP